MLKEDWERGGLEPLSHSFTLLTFLCFLIHFFSHKESLRNHHRLGEIEQGKNSQWSGTHLKKPIVRRVRTLKGSPKLPHSPIPTPILLLNLLLPRFSSLSCRVCLFVFVFGRVADSSESKSRLRLFFCGCRQCADQVIYFIIKSWPEFTGECQSCFIIKSWPELTVDCQSCYLQD